MKKFYLLLTLLLVAFVGRAETVVDELTATGLGLDISYDYVEGKTFTSATQYTAAAMNGSGTIQITSGSKTIKNTTRFVGVYNTTSVGNARKVEVTWNSGTTNGRVLNVYGKATPFVSTSAYDEQGGTLIGSITYGTTTTLDITGDYPYLAFASKKSAQYIKSLKITWETGGETTVCAAPTFSEEEGTFYGNADETKNVTLSCATDGATIKYTVNGGAEQTYNGTNIPELVFPGTYEVTAWATKDGLENSATVTKNYKLVDVASLDLYTKVTDASALKAGDKVIIVNEGVGYALSTKQNSNNRGYSAYETLGDGILATGEIQVITLEDATTGSEESVKGFAFNVGNGYLYSPSSSSNYLRTQTSNNDNGIWTISIDESGNANIISQGTNNIIQYNTNKLFSSYPQTKLQQPVQLYYPAPAAEKCAAPTFSVEEGTHYGFNAETKEVTLSCSTKGATIMYSINGGEEVAYEAPITLSCPSSTTISAYAMMADGSLANSATVSKTYNYVVYPAVLSIADFKTQGAADAKKPYMFTCPLTVTYQNGIRLYLRDEAGDAILVYGAIEKTYEAGQQLPANAVVGTYDVYNQVAEIIPVAGVTWPESDGTADASPIVMTIEQLNAVTEAEWSTLASKLVVIKGAKINAEETTITVGEESFTSAYAKRFKPTLENANCVYDIVGIIETHYNSEAKAVDGIQFCQTAYLDNYSPEKMYMIGYIQSKNQDWNPTQGIEMAKEAAGRYSADVNLSFNDWFAVTSRIAENNDQGGWTWVNGDRYAYTSDVFGKVATDYEMTKGDGKTQVFWAGNFKVTVDYFAKTISFVPAAVDGNGNPDYSTVFPEKLRIVGAIADGSWAGESIVENHLATRGEDGYTYTFNELQFVNVNDGDNGRFRITTAWDATNWDGSYSVNGRALKAATDAEPRINFNTVANILPFTTNDLVADVQKYGGYDFDFANLQLIVNLKDMTVTGTMSSGVSQIKVGSATVTATNGTIRVDGGNTTSIYNIAGQAIALGSQAKEFSVARGMYIVNVDGKATKVVVR